MKILHITQLSEQLIKTSPIINDIISDMILHGLKEVYGNDVIDYPGAWYMYKDEVIKRPVNNKLWGNGFTYYDSFENYKSTDRSDIQNKIKKNYFDYIIYGSFTRSCKFFEDSVNSKSKIILIDGEDNTNLNLNRNKKIIFFKRELLKKNENVFPLNISIPKKKNY